ncbi:MAG: oligosaccharide flippase family protein, partial [Elusimicrobiales bacterium]|nr:oligosaccharide flippase family protein [Elusimicrobiales bacterium]
IAVHRENKEKIQEIFNSVMIIKFILLILSLILLTVLVVFFDKFMHDWKVYYLTFLIVLGNILFPVWFFQGMEKMKYITILNILAKGLFTIAIFILVKKQSDYWKVPLLNGLGYIFSGILSLLIIKKSFGLNFRFVEFSKIKFYFIDSSQFFLSRFSVSIYTSSNAFVLGLFTNNTVVGHYSIAEKLYQAIQYLYHPITQVLYPYIANTRNSLLFKKIFKIIVSFNTVLLILIFVLANLIFSLLFSNQADFDTITTFRILLLSAIVVIPSIMMGYPFLGAMGYTNFANISVIYGSLIHLLGLIILSFLSLINIYLIAIMVVITESFVLIYRIYLSKKAGIWMKGEEK